LADHLVLVATVSQARLPAVSAGFANRVVASAVPVVVVSQGRSRRLLMAACVALSSAATMLLAISLVWKAREAGTHGEKVVTTGMTSADLIVDSTNLWSNQFAMAANGASLRLDEVEKVAPSIRPLRQSLAMLLDALRRAFQTRPDPTSQPPQQQTGNWPPLSCSLT